MNKKLLFWALMLFPLIAWNQSRTVWLDHADKFYEKEDFHNALLNYQKALSDTSGLKTLILPYEIDRTTQKLKNKDREVDSTRAVPLKDYIDHQIASCYLKTFDYGKAVQHFEKTSSFASYPDDLYHFGVSQMNVDQHEAAISSFEKYIASESYNDSLLRSAQLSITGCYYALDKENIKVKVNVSLADTNVFNKGTASFAPMYFGSEEEILFTSARDGGVIFDPEKQNSAYLCDLYWTKSNGSGGWSDAKNFGRPLNSAQHDASGAFSTTHSIIYYTRWSDQSRKDQNIYLARMVDLKFYESFKLPASVNVPGYKSINPHVTKDGKWLYFSSNRPGGEGGMDIWKIALDETGNVTGEAVNMGRPINSELDEVTPFYHETSATLFFSSNGHNSIGGLDIFKSSFNRGNKAFGKVVNLGIPINSSKDDAYMIWDNLMNKGFFSSDREDCEAGHCYDIYEVTNEPIVIVLEGYTYDIETEEILPNTQLKFKDIDFKFEDFTIDSDEKGFYRKELDQNQEIFIKAQRPSYFADAASVNTKPIVESKTIIQDFYLRPIPKDEIEIEGIEYDFDSDRLRPRSKEILDELYDFLVLNNNLVVEINSHTDSRGSDSYNRNLAKRRAASCVKYLISKGIADSRLIAKGYGEDQPNFLKDDAKKPILDENGERILLTEAYINSQPTEEIREEYHQRNRRTSFKVVGEGFDIQSN